MTTEPVGLHLRGARARRALDLRSGWLKLAAALAGAVGLGWILSNAQVGIHDPRVANPNVTPGAGALRWGGESIDHFWVPIFYGVTALVMVLMIGVMVRHRLRTGHHHPALPIFLVLFLQILMDPLYNWAMYCNYDPSLLHWPVSWSVFNVSPTVEPLWIVMGAYQVFFLGPAWLAFAAYQRLSRRVSLTSWVNRRPLLSLFLFAWVIGSGADILMEQWMLNMDIYKYTQIAGPSLGWGHGHLQVTEICWIGFLIAVCAVMLHRDDRGWTVGQRVSQSSHLLKRVGLGAAGTTVAIVTVSLLLYGGFFATLRLTGSDTNIAAGGWPYPTAKTYDPNGRLEAAGIKGPYFTGTWCTGSHCVKG